jgi:predicted DNA-binding transcriptional regulator AlpA
MTTTVVPPEGAQTAVTTVRRRMIDGKEVGLRLNCSWRHVLRMADRGQMPWGLKLGALRRWDAEEIERWIAGGCKPGHRTRKG